MAKSDYCINYIRHTLTLIKGFFVTACIFIQTALAIRLTQEPEVVTTSTEESKIGPAIGAALEAKNEEILKLENSQTVKSEGDLFVHKQE